MCFYVMNFREKNDLLKENAALILPFYIDYREPIKGACIIFGEIVLVEPYIDPDDYNYEKELSCHVCDGYYPKIKREKKI